MVLRLVVCAFVLLAAACSPYGARKDLAAAEQALTSAEKAGAARYATYEYAAAAEYLHKAKEEASYSDFEGARIFANRSLDYSDRAQTRAESGRREVMKERPPEPPGSVVEPPR
jgi:hypothetical protein